MATILYGQHSHRRQILLYDKLLSNGEFFLEEREKKIDEEIIDNRPFTYCLSSIRLSSIRLSSISLKKVWKIEHRTLITEYFFRA